MGPRLGSCLDKRVEQRHKFREGAILAPGSSRPPVPHHEKSRYRNGHFRDWIGWARSRLGREPTQFAIDDERFTRGGKTDRPVAGGVARADLTATRGLRDLHDRRGRDPVASARYESG
jgi:hypothetical protein